jgi:hypothetical protein
MCIITLRWFITDWYLALDKMALVDDVLEVVDEQCGLSNYVKISTAE